MRAALNDEKGEDDVICGDERSCFTHLYLAYTHFYFAYSSLAGK